MEKKVIGHPVALALPPSSNPSAAMAEHAKLETLFKRFGLSAEPEGYERLEDKLGVLGGRVARVADNATVTAEALAEAAAERAVG